MRACVCVYVCVSSCSDGKTRQDIAADRKLVQIKGGRHSLGPGIELVRRKTPKSKEGGQGEMMKEEGETDGLRWAKKKKANKKKINK